MEVRFIITLEDGTQIASHNPEGVLVKDHAHALAPHNDKKWVSYEMISPNGTPVSVNFQTGIFTINGVEVSPTDDKERLLTSDRTPQEFPVTAEWAILNGLPYFPVVGRRRFVGDWGELNYSVCGWKRKVGENTIQKLIYLSSDGKIIFT